MAGAFVAEQIAYVVTGEWRATLNLPLQFSDAVTFVAIAALWRPAPAARRAAVVLGAHRVAAGDAHAGPRAVVPGRPLLHVLRLTHGGALVAVVVLRALPQPGGMWRAYAATLAWTALAAAGDLVTGGNYMFLRHKPSHGSLLDVMGPWPLYIAAAAVLALALFAVLQVVGDVVRERTDRTGTIA